MWLLALGLGLGMAVGCGELNVEAPEDRAVFEGWTTADVGGDSTTAPTQGDVYADEDPDEAPQPVEAVPDASMPALVEVDAGAGFDAGAAVDAGVDAGTGSADAGMTAMEDASTPDPQDADAGGMPPACGTGYVGATPTTVVASIEHFADDAEESVIGSPGDVYLDSSDLEMTDDSAFGFPQQVVGLRFASVAVPQGAVIESAHVEFQADRDESGTTNLVLSLEASDSASAFTTTPYDLSDRPRMSPTVSWDAIPAWSEGQLYSTPELSEALQGIVCRAGWSSGNAVVVLVEGTGVREATAYDTSPAAAARLHVRYRM